MTIEKNGNLIEGSRVRVGASPTSTTAFTSTAITTVAANDEISAVAYHEAGTALNVNAYLTIERVGPTS